MHNRPHLRLNEEKIHLYSRAAQAVSFCFVAYLAICLLLYWQQERLLFFPTKLPANFRYSFTQPFTEITLPVERATINLVHFHRAQRAPDLLEEARVRTRPDAKGVILYLLKYPMRTDLALPAVTCPVYLIHGTADPVIPYSASERLYPLIQGEKDFLPVIGGGHNLLLREARVRTFLQKIL